MKNFESGRKIKHNQYQYFSPSIINRQWIIDDMEMIDLLSKADRELGRLDAYSDQVNVELYISMHIAKEATLSSRIEGTQTNLEQSFYSEGELAGEFRDDWQEVRNYINAMRHADIAMNDLPFSSRLLRQAHQLLLEGVRGANKAPGEFRRSQNWIGGATLMDAIFIPPLHSEIPDLMSDLEKFAHNHALHLPELVKIAIMHYQFETIHPFLDGNGRVGRLMITLYLIRKGILKQPILYLSDFLQSHRKLYYENLNNARTNNQITQWIKFFLVGVFETAKKGVAAFEAIKKLESTIDAQLKSLGSREAKAREVVNALYNRPVIDASMVVKTISTTAPTAYKLISDLERLNILQEVTGNKRGKFYVFRKYLNLFE